MLGGVLGGVFNCQIPFVQGHFRGFGWGVGLLCEKVREQVPLLIIIVLVIRAILSMFDIVFV